MSPANPNDRCHPGAVGVHCMHPNLQKDKILKKKFMKMKLKMRLLTAVSLVIVSCPVHTFGAEDKIEPSLEAKGEYNDNIFLTGNNEMDDFISTLKPGILLSRTTERLGASLKGYLSLITYSDNNELNAVDHDYTGDFSFLPTETTKVKASANYLKDSRPDRDILTTGEVLDSSIRERERYDLSGEWNITEISGLGVNYGYYEDDYDDLGTSSYYAHFAGLGYTRNLSRYFANTTGRLNFNYGKYEFNTSSVDNYVFSVGFDRDLSEIWQFSLAAGPRLTRTEFDSAALSPEEDWGVTGQATLRYNGETSWVDFNASHEVSASSGSSGTVERTTFRVNMSRRFTEELRAGMWVHYIRNKTDSDISVLRVNEHNYRIHPRLTYNFTRDFLAELSYAFTFIDDKDDNLERERNTVFLRLEKKFDLLN